MRRCIFYHMQDAFLFSPSEIELGRSRRRKHLTSSRVFSDIGLISRINDTYLDQTQDSREFLWELL